MHLYRTRFANDIVAEFLPPTDPDVEEVNPSASNEVIIFLSGMPSVPDQESVVRFFAARDFWTVLPRYRGSWESDGIFLKDSPVRDLAYVISGLYDEVTEVYDHKSFRPDPSAIHVIGSSFGGGVALEAAAQLDAIDTTIALSPVVDWQADERVTPMQEIKRFVEDGFGRGYRTAENGWSNLKDGRLFNPINTAAQAPGEDILIIYSTDDTVVALPPIEQYVKESAANTRVFEDKGHLGGSDAIEPPIADMILEFLG